jgi:hypothetical protein
MPKKKSTWKVTRSAITGKFVRKQDGITSPRTTVRETMKISKKKK